MFGLIKQGNVNEIWTGMAKKSQNGRKIPKIPDAVKNIAIWTLQYGQNLSKIARN